MTDESQHVKYGKEKSLKYKYGKKRTAGYHSFSLSPIEHETVWRNKEFFGNTPYKLTSIKLFLIFGHNVQQRQKSLFFSSFFIVVIIVTIFWITLYCFVVISENLINNANGQQMHKRISEKILFKLPTTVIKIAVSNTYFNHTKTIIVQTYSIILF